MDEIDKRLLREVQRDASRSTAELGRRVGLTAMPVWRRLQKLRKEGFLRRTVALVDRKALGLPITAIVMLRTNRHDADWFEELAAFVASEEAVVEFHRLSGEIDFLLKVVLADMDDYQSFYRRMIRAVPLMDVSASFAFESIKETTEVPVR